MKQVRTTVTRKGQVTVPVEIRRALGLREGDKVIFTLDGNEARLARTGSVVERTAGVFKSHSPPSTAEELREIAEKAIAADVVERMSR